MALSSSQRRAEDRRSYDEDYGHRDDVWAVTLIFAFAFAAAGWLVLFTAPEEDRHGLRLVSAVVLFVLANVLAIRGVGRKEMADGVSCLRPVVSSVLEPLWLPRSEWQWPALTGLYRGHEVTVSTSEAVAVGTSYYSPASLSISVPVRCTDPNRRAGAQLYGFDDGHAMLKAAVRRAAAQVTDELRRQDTGWRGPFGEPHIYYRRHHGGGRIYYTVTRRCPLPSLTPEDFKEPLELLIRVERRASGLTH
ncbi:MAG TPA: hypothetical protein VMZ51_08955 [Acidimicrobiales bacterium]|nr:hypothetical protein [Acidimicrobiales bacterium]